MASRRPLWFLLIALLWGLIGYYFTLKIDAWGLQLAETFGATDPTSVTALAGVAWLLVGMVPFMGGLIWIMEQPAWRPFRDTIAAGIIFGLVPAFMHSTALGFGHIERDIATGTASAIVAGMSLVTFVPIGIVVAFMAANKIWATPEPIREKRFGTRPDRVL